MEPVSEIMTPQPVKVPGSSTVAVVLAMMHSQGVRHIPVVDSDGALVGVVTDYAAHLAEPDAPATTAAVPVEWLGPDTPIDVALETLDSTTLDSVVIVDGQLHPIGIFTEHDAVRLAPVLLGGISLALRRPERPLVTVRSSDTWIAAFEKMVDHGIRHIPVVDGDLVRTVVSLRDLIAAGVTRGRDGSMETFLSRGEVHVAIEGITVCDAATRMAEARIGCLPLMDFAHRPVGIITRTDVIAQMILALRSKA